MRANAHGGWPSAFGIGVVELKIVTKIIEDFVAWPCGLGYVLDYGDRHSLRCLKMNLILILMTINIEIKAFETKKRLLSFCRQEPLHIVLPVLKFLAQEHRNLVDDSDYPPPDEPTEKFQNLIWFWKRGCVHRHRRVFK